MPKRTKSKMLSLRKKGFVKASNKTSRFTYYFNPKTRKVFKDTDRDGRKG